MRCLTTRTTSWCSVRGARTGKKSIWVLVFVLFLSVLKLGFAGKTSFKFVCVKVLFMLMKIY